MKQLIIILPIFIFFISCGKSPEIKFDKEGVSLTCPSGWKITDEKKLDSMGYFLSIEREGLNSSGVYAMNWITDSIDLDSYIEVYKDNLKENIIYKHSDLKFDKSIWGKFNSNNSLVSTYSLSLIGLKHEGTIYVFYSNGKTVTVLKQGAVEDKDKNEEGFEVVEKSFVVKE